MLHNKNIYPVIVLVVAAHIIGTVYSDLSSFEPHGAGYLETCNDSIPCDSDIWLECRPAADNITVCNCPAETYWNGTAQVPGRDGVLGTCLAKSWTACNKTDSPPNFLFDTRPYKRCTPHAFCDALPNRNPNVLICICLWPEYRSDTNGLCLPNFGSSCSEDDPCNAELNLKCRNGTCACDEKNGAFWDQESCVKPVGGRCKFPADFGVNECVENAACSEDGTCRCKESFQASYKGTCGIPLGASCFDHPCMSSMSCLSSFFRNPLEPATLICGCKEQYEVLNRSTNICQRIIGAHWSNENACIDNASVNELSECECKSPFVTSRDKKSCLSAD